MDQEIITLHEIPFTIWGGIPVTQELRDRLEAAARKQIRWPVIISRRETPHPYFRYYYEFAPEEDAGEGLPSVPVTVGGIKTKILLPGDPPVQIDDRDINIARWLWTSGLYLFHDMEGGVGMRKTISFHEVPFAIDDNIALNHELLDKLEDAACRWIRRPIAIRRFDRKGEGSPKYSYNFLPSSVEETGKQPGAVKVSVGGIETVLVCPDEPAMASTEGALRNAWYLWTQSAFVSIVEDGEYYIDFY